VFPVEEPLPGETFDQLGQRGRRDTGQIMATTGDDPADRRLAEAPELDAQPLRDAGTEETILR
jgi:hypothetical protein